MQSINTSTPIQRQNSWPVSMLKKALRTQFGKKIAFMVGLRGFNRAKHQILRFQGKFLPGMSVGKGQVVLTNKDNENIPVGEAWLYRREAPQFVYNSRVDKGAALQASLMSGSSLGSIASPLPPIYVALSTSTLSPAKGDTTLSGETSVAGLARALGTVQNYVAPSTLDGAASYDVFKQFTLTGSATTVVSSALFDASSSGNLFVEANFSSSAAMATNDILQVTWTVNI